MKKRLKKLRCERKKCKKKRVLEKKCLFQKFFFPKRKKKPSTRFEKKKPTRMVTLIIYAFLCVNNIVY